jgi:hypothetical protein
MIVMTSRKAHNFEHAVRLVIEQPDLGCDLINLYYNSPSERIRNYVTFLKCNYCYERCPQNFQECVNALRFLYKNGLISLSEFRTVLGRFLVLKRKGYLS